MSDYKRQNRPHRRADRFKKPTSTETPDTTPQPQSRWGRWRAERRKYVIERKKAQAGIAMHRKWVLMWAAVIVVAVVILALAIMNKLSITGLIF